LWRALRTGLIGMIELALVDLFFGPSARLEVQQPAASSACRRCVVVATVR
jgi:hypothetical protein